MIFIDLSNNKIGLSGARWSLTSVLFGNKIYLFGGYVFSFTLPHKRANDLITLDVGISISESLVLNNLENMTWEKIREDNVLQTSLIMSDERLQAEKINNKIYISGQQFGEFIIFDPSKIIFV